MARKKYHASVDIESLLRNMKGKKITFFDDDDRNPMSDAEVRLELANEQALGHELIGPDNCEGFDPFGGGCPGHPITEPTPPQEGTKD